MIICICFYFIVSLHKFDSFKNFLKPFKFLLKPLFLLRTQKEVAIMLCSFLLLHYQPEIQFQILEGRSVVSQPLQQVLLLA